MTKTKDSYQLNIDLPKHPKGMVIYHEYELLPSQFKKDQVYAGNHEWYSMEHGQKVQVWKWISEMIETCVQMSGWDDLAKSLVTKL